MSVEKDIEQWTRDKMAKVISDAMVRCEIAGIADVRSGFMITSLIIEFAACAVAATTLPADEAGKMFTDSVATYRKRLQAARARQ